MSAIQTDLIRPSIARLIEHWQPSLERFHAHLERLNPRLRYLLPSSFERYTRLGLSLVLKEGAAVTGGPGLTRLGHRLRAKGFEPSDIDILGAACLATIEEIIGGGLCTATREEWVKLYRMLRPTFAEPGDGA